MLTAVAVGLVLGKPLGVLAASWLVLRSGLATLPTGTGFRHLLVLGSIAGIGFTMALFIAQLAFIHPALLDAAKLGVLGASASAGLIGLALGRWLLAPTRPSNLPSVAPGALDATRSAV